MREACEASHVTIGIAKDEAFCFLYEDNIQYLKEKGCRIQYFSPIHDNDIPNTIDAMILCGGYPELYGEALSQNRHMKKKVRELLYEGIPCIAECGGFLYLQKELRDKEGNVYEMAGFFEGGAFPAERLRHFGYVNVSLQNGWLWNQETLTFRAHEFHYYDCEKEGQDFLVEKASNVSKWNGGYAQGNFYAGFPHIYFYGNDAFAEGFLKAAERFNRKKAAEALAEKRWDFIAKPLKGLGLLENIFIKIAGIQGTSDVQLKKRAVLTFCGDNGIVAQGVTQTDDSVTAVVADNLAEGKASVCKMCQKCDTDVFCIDVGIARQTHSPKITDRKIRKGTRDFSVEPAMTEEETKKAIHCGIAMVKDCREMGYRILGIGEMGIGNTTTASALAVSLLGLDTQKAVGRGAGLSDEGLKRKKQVIEDAVLRYDLRNKEAFEVLRHVGGLDIAAMAGSFIGGFLYGVPVVLDGMISAVAALVAYRLCPASRNAMIASHISREPCMEAVLKELGLQAVIDGKLALGEGTGAALLFPMLDMAEAVYRSEETFQKMEIEQYERFV